MGATLDTLHRLQIIETQLRRIQERIESKRRSVQAHKRRRTKFQRQLDDTHQAIQQAQAEADRHELQRRSHEEHIAKLREALNQAKTNKEYAAILTQLNTDKADVLKVEDAALAALARVDELKKQEADSRVAIENAEAKLGELERAAAGLEAELSGKLVDLETQRSAASEDVPPQALNLFRRACDKHDGEALALIAQAHPKRAEYNCTGCNMSLTLETVNALQSSGDAVQVCQTCSRILYLDLPAGAAAERSSAR